MNNDCSCNKIIRNEGRICPLKPQGLCIRLSKLLTRRENYSQKGVTGQEFGPKISLPDGNLALKYPYRTGIWLSNILTEQEFGSQKSLPDENWALLSGNDI